MERQHGLNNQQRSLFRGYPQMNAGYLGWHSYSAHFKESSTCPHDSKNVTNMPRSTRKKSKNGHLSCDAREGIKNLSL